MSDTLRRLQELHQAATPGPWQFNDVTTAEFFRDHEPALREALAALDNT